MKIAVISDLHLGYRQYGLMVREQDFYHQFLLCMEAIKKENVDLVIIAGDLFDKPNPSPEAMNVYRTGIEKLNGVPVITIKGNHTMLMRENHFSVDNYFDSENFTSEYHLLDDSTYQKDDVVIQGMYYRSDSNLEEFVEKQWKMVEGLSGNEDSFNILVLHQAFEEYCGFSNIDLSIGDINWYPYDVVICGHIHSHTCEHIREGESNIFLQPGSIERMNIAEARDGQENGKGYWIIDTETHIIDFYSIDFKRDFLLGDIEFDTLEDIENHFEELEKSCSKLKEDPIIAYNYYDNSGNSVHIRELMKDTSKYCLVNNSNVYNMAEEDVVVEISEGEIPTILDAIKSQDGLSKEEAKLAADIHEAYKNNLDDSVEGILSTYFINLKERQKEKDKMDKYHEGLEREIKEYEEFFDNLGRKKNV